MQEEQKKDHCAELAAGDNDTTVVPASQLPHDEPEVVVRRGPHPLQALYSDPEWRRSYFSQFTKAELVRMLVNSPASNGAGRNVGSHGTQSLSEASGSAQSAAQETKDSKMADTLSSAGMDVTQARTLKDYRPQHDDGCASRRCEHCNDKWDQHVAKAFGRFGCFNFTKKPCTCGLDALLAVVTQPDQPSAETRQAQTSEPRTTGSTDALAAEIMDAFAALRCAMTHEQETAAIGRVIAAVRADEQAKQTRQAQTWQPIDGNPFPLLPRTVPHD